MKIAAVLLALVSVHAHPGVQAESVTGTPPLYQSPGIHVCNATDRTVSAALATRIVKDPMAPNSYQVHAVGWFRVVPGQCFTLPAALKNLQQLGEQYYIYARSAVSTWYGDGSNPNATFCTTQGAAFNFRYLQKSPYCPKGVMKPYDPLIPVPGVQSFVVMLEQNGIIKTRGVAVPTPTSSPS